MRATSMRRLLGGAASLLLIGTMLLTAAGSATAADTRLIYVGSDPGFALNNGTITFTPVSTGGTSATTVYVKNIDNQSLTHVVLTFKQTQGDVTIGSTVYGANASSCSAANDLITCDFGTLKANATRSFLLTLTAPGTVASYPVHGTVYFNESTNPNGGNQQINAVDGSLDVTLGTCHTISTFLPPGQAAKVLPTDGSCPLDVQQSALFVPANANGSIVSLDDSQAPTSCPSGYSCFGHQVSASVNNGATVSPYLTWFITYSADTMKGINPRQVAFQHGDFIILAGKKGACGGTFTQDCNAGYTVDPVTGAVTFELHTRTNSVMKGLS